MCIYMHVYIGVVDQGMAQALVLSEEMVCVYVYITLTIYIYIQTYVCIYMFV